MILCHLLDGEKSSADRTILVVKMTTNTWDFETHDAVMRELGVFCVDVRWCAMCGKSDVLSYFFQSGRHSFIKACPN